MTDAHTNAASHKDDFPYCMRWVPFSRHSADNDSYNTKNIIIGGNNKNEITFHEILVPSQSKPFKNNNNNTCQITYKSLEIDPSWNKKCANLDIFGKYSAALSHSYLIKNDKYLIVFDANSGYNVYDIHNDYWLLDEQSMQINRTLHYSDNNSTRSMLINHEIIVISCLGKLYFYSIAYDITHPVLLHSYNIKSKVEINTTTRNRLFMFHGMCCVDLYKISSKNNSDNSVSSEKDDPNEEVTTCLMFKIVLFGGYAISQSFLESFLCLDVILTYKSKFGKFTALTVDVDDSGSDDESRNIIENIVKQGTKLKIDENGIDADRIICKNFDRNILSSKEWYAFGYECIKNAKNENIIIIIGGKCGLIKKGMISKSIYLYNCVTNEIILRKNVKYFFYLFLLFFSFFVKTYFLDAILDIIYSFYHLAVHITHPPAFGRTRIVIMIQL